MKRGVQHVFNPSCFKSKDYSQDTLGTVPALTPITCPHVPGCCDTLGTHLSFNFFCLRQKEEADVPGVQRKCD